MVLIHWDRVSSSLFCVEWDHWRVEKETLFDQSADRIEWAGWYCSGAQKRENRALIDGERIVGCYGCAAEETYRPQAG